MEKITKQQVLNCQSLSIREVAILLRFLDEEVLITRLESTSKQLAKKPMKLLNRNLDLDEPDILENKQSKFFTVNKNNFDNRIKKK